MLGQKGQSSIQCFFQVLRGLPGQAQHQVQVEVVDAPCPCHPHRLFHLLPAVPPPDGLKQMGLAGLGAQGQAVDTALDQSLHKDGGQGLRVGLATGLHVRRPGEGGLQGLQEGRHLFWRHQAGGPPADEQGVSRWMAQRLPPACDLPAQGILIGPS